VSRIPTLINSLSLRGRKKNHRSAGRRRSSRYPVRTVPVCSASTISSTPPGSGDTRSMHAIHRASLLKSGRNSRRCERGYPPGSQHR
jgi:hypothetical protein